MIFKVCITQREMDSLSRPLLSYPMNHVEVRKEIKGSARQLHSQDPNLDFAPVVCRRQWGSIEPSPASPVPCLGGHASALSTANRYEP